MPFTNVGTPQQRWVPEENPYKKGDAPPYGLEPRSVAPYLMTQIAKHARGTEPYRWDSPEYATLKIAQMESREEIRQLIWWLCAQGNIEWDGWS